jgi:tripartite-type tricarboxylate transporter receptor subunit TctC
LFGGAQISIGGVLDAVSPPRVSVLSRERGRAPDFAPCGGRRSLSVAPSPHHRQLSSLRGLAITSTTRSELLPDVPAVGEFVPGYQAVGWVGVGTPKGTPTEIIDKLNKEIDALVAEPQMKARLLGLGVEPKQMTPAEFGTFIADEYEKWADVIRKADVRPE